VSRVCQPRPDHLMMGLSVSAAKDTYRLRAAERGRKRTATPYAFCFNVLVDWIMRDIRIGPVSNTEGVAFVLESGHENNAEVEKEFHAIKQQHPDIAHLLESICFVSKESCRAIQLADLFAFYSRRNDAAMYRARMAGQDSYKIETMIRIVTENLPHRAYVATDFGPNAPGSRFFGGDL
jgi:hypothetical protein